MAAEAGYSIRLSARVDAYVRAMNEAAKATGQFADDTAKNMEKVGGQLQAVGSKMTKFVTLPLVGLGVGAGVAAVQWESAWAGVTKTVDGTAEQLQRLEGDLRNMTQELPATHGEIAAVAEAAGQLGVSVDDVAAFSRTMLDLGETTNMSATEAATQLARFMNIVGTAQGDVGNLGASIVALGNNFATTEAEIVDMSMRLAGAGRQAGLTEGDILGIATALSSVGIESEAGGTAFSRTMMRIEREVELGGDKLAMFASVAGMSASQFAAAWQDDAGGALAAFIDGLGTTEERGMSLNQVLETLGITEIREADALRRSAAARGLLNEAMTVGNDEFAKGTALAEEAGKRYETTAAQLEILRNQVVDLGIQMGDALLPALQTGTSFVGGLVRAFAALPGPVQAVVVGFLGVAAAIGPLLWVGGTVVKNLQQMRNMLTLVQTRLGALGGAAQVASVGMGALAAAAVAYGISQQRAAERTRRITESIQELSRVADDEVLETFARQLLDTAINGGDLADITRQIARENIEGARRIVEIAEATGQQNHQTEMLAAAIRNEEQARAQAVETTERHGDATVDTTAEIEALAEAETLAAEETAYLEEVTRLAAEATDVFGRTFAETGQQVVDWAGELDAAGQAADDLRADVESAFSGAKSEISSFSDEAMNDLGLFRQELIDDAVAMYSWQDNLVTIASSTSTEFALFLADMGLAGAGLVEDLATNEGELQSTFDAWTLATAVGSRDMATEFAKVDPAFRRVLDGIPDSMSTSWQSIRAREKSEAETTGAAITDGVAAGVDSRAWWLRVRVAAVIASALEAAREAAGISSPSRLFRDEVGVFIAEGVAVGIAETGHRIGEEMSQAINAAMREAIEATRGDLEDVMTSLDSVWADISSRRNMEDLQQGVVDAEQAVTDAMIASLQAAAEYGVGSEEHVRAQERQEQAAQRLEEANLRLLKASEELLVSGQMAEDQYIALAEAAGLEAAEIERLINVYRALAEARAEADRVQSEASFEAAAAQEIARKFQTWAGTGRWSQSVLDSVAALQRNDPGAALAWMTQMVADAERDLAAWTSGNRATGGPVSRGRLYEVGEGNRPELLSSGGRSYLIPGNGGHVTPMSASGSMGGTTVINQENHYHIVSNDPEAVVAAIKTYDRWNGTRIALGAG